MSRQPLMPKSSAIWLIDNTSLSFNQIAEFCKLHPLEIKAIADGETSQGIKGLDLIATGQLTRNEITKGEADKNYKIKLSEPRIRIPEIERRGARYTPVSKRQDRPNAILWLIRNHPELKNIQISRLVGTTKSTIEQIRDRTHWNSANLTPIDPVTLGLCSQIDLDLEVKKSANNRIEPLVEDIGEKLQGSY
ncbi:cytoplasmic protein [Liberibacter crescens]|nr:cytoplasmic protein [Liberibacter crescens]